VHSIIFIFHHLLALSSVGAERIGIGFIELVAKDGGFVFTGKACKNGIFHDPCSRAVAVKGAFLYGVLDTGASIATDVIVWAGRCAGYVVGGS
jgi:hypothetical protein